MVFAFPWLWGLPLAFAGRGARGAAATARAWLVAMPRACTASLARPWCVLLASLLRSRLSILVRGVSARGCWAGWVLGVAGGVFDGSWSAIERCGGGRWRFEGQSDNLGELFCSPHDDVSEHGESSLGAELFAALASRGVRAE